MRELPESWNPAEIIIAVFSMLVIFACGCDLAIAHWQKRRAEKQPKGYFRRIG